MPEDGLAGLVDPEGRRNLMVATLSHGNKNKLQRGLRRCPRDRGHVARHTKAAHTASRQQLFEDVGGVKVISHWLRQAVTLNVNPMASW